MGLALGFHAPGEGFIDPNALKDTNHALVGAGGDGGLTHAERLGACHDGGPGIHDLWKLTSELTVSVVSHACIHGAVWTQNLRAINSTASGEKAYDISLVCVLPPQDCLRPPSWGPTTPGTTPRSRPPQRRNKASRPWYANFHSRVILSYTP